MLRKKLFRHSSIYILGSVIVNGGGFLLIPLYTKYLSPSEYGIWGSVSILSSFLISVLGFGVHGTINRFYYEFDDQKRWKVFFGTISKFVILFGLVVTLLLFFLGAPFLDSIFKSVRFEPYLKLGVIIGFLGVIPVIALALFQAKQQVIVYRTFTTISFILLTTCMLIFVVLMGKGVLGALYAQVISGILMSIVYLYFILKEGTKTISTEHLGMSLKFGFPLMFYAISGFVTEMASRYFIERFTTLSELGVFNLAQQYASGLIMVVTAISMAWTPIFFEKAKEPDSQIVFSKFGLYLIVIVSGIALIMSLFAPEFITILASEKYYSAQEIIPLLLLSYVFGNGFWILMITPIIYTKQAKYLPWITALSGGISILANIILIPRLGIMGAAIAQLISYIALVYVAYKVADKVYPIDYDFGKIALILMSSIGMFLLSLSFNPREIFFAILYKIFLFCCFACLLFMFKVLSIVDVLGQGKFFNKLVPKLN